MLGPPGAAPPRPPPGVEPMEEGEIQEGPGGPTRGHWEPHGPGEVQARSLARPPPLTCQPWVLREAARPEACQHPRPRADPPSGASSGPRGRPGWAAAPSRPSLSRRQPLALHCFSVT